MPTPPPTTPDPAGLHADALRARFDAHRALTVGLEEEVMILDPATHDLVPAAEDVLAAVDGDARFKRELPAAQVELVGAPAASVPEAAAGMAGARRALVAAVGGRFAFGAAGVHPTAAVEGELNRGPVYDHTRSEFGPVARRQLVFGLHVHVAVPGADAAIGVYNGLRARLPELAALGAHGAFYAGADSGLASVRPVLSRMLPRQGVPPALSSFEAFADALAWGTAAGALPSASQWWWELRLHPSLGTVEVRVPDAQATVADVAALAAVVHALVGRLAEDPDERPVADTWRIEENRWSACRHGVEGSLADLVTGQRRPTRDVLHELLDHLEATGERLRCTAELRHARALVERNGALRQRAVASTGGGARAVAADLAARFTATEAG